MISPIDLHEPVPLPIDEHARRAAQQRQRELVKPPGSLGRLEELAIWLAAVTGHVPPELRSRVVVAAADHGVAVHGVSAYPAEVTAQMLRTFHGALGAVAVLADQAGADLVLVDAGVRDAPDLDGVVRTGLQPSRDLSSEPALSPEGVDNALATGRTLAAQAAQDGITVLAGGEMGIANTTPATCLACWLTGHPPRELTGPGTGLDQEGVAHKAALIERALALHTPHIGGPRDALQRLGGGEIAVLSGLVLGACEHGLGYVCDGLIATAAAALAAAIAPGVRPRLLAGHRSPEPAHDLLLDRLGLDPVLNLGMRLGEASGAATALSILQLAVATHNRMATFAEAGVSRG